MNLSWSSLHLIIVNLDSSFHHNSLNFDNQLEFNFVETLYKVHIQHYLITFLNWRAKIKSL